MTGQDWLEKDFYAILGVAKDADVQTIKKAYRKLARELHPDHNPGDASSEALFKDVGEAYSVLNDPRSREEYDKLRTLGSGARFTGGTSGGGSGATFQDLFGEMFGSQRRAASGAEEVRIEDLFGGLFGGFRAEPATHWAGFEGERLDVEASVEISFRDAVLGATLNLEVGDERVSTRIPPGLQDGQLIRVKGRGRKSAHGGTVGDLLLRVEVKPHPVFTREGLNLHVRVPVSLAEMVLGAEIEVPCLDGRVKVRVPAGMRVGQTLRVEGKGVPGKQRSGDLLVTLEVNVPEKLSTSAKLALEAFSKLSGEGRIRDELLKAAENS